VTSFLIKAVTPTRGPAIHHATATATPTPTPSPSPSPSPSISVSSAPVISPAPSAPGPHGTGMALVAASGLTAAVAVPGIVWLFRRRRSTGTRGAG
jgi:hypothetical protein